MIVQISGKLVEKRDQSLVINVSGICYEVIVPTSVLNRIEETLDPEGNVSLITYYYFQIGPGSGNPMMIGFINEVERDFFLQFIKVSGIGPRAAVKAFNKSISEITKAIEEGDLKSLQTLPGIGAQKAKEIVAKLQGKVGRFGLIQDKNAFTRKNASAPDWQEEALSILLQLQYTRHEASEMIKKASTQLNRVNSAEELLNEIYKQKVKK